MRRIAIIATLTLGILLPTRSSGEKGGDRRMSAKAIVPRLRYSANDRGGSVSSGSGGGHTPGSDPRTNLRRFAQPPGWSATMRRAVLRASGPSLLLALAVSALPAFASEAQQAGRLQRIGMLFAAAPRGSSLDEAFRQGLRELGWREGKNVIVDFRSADKVIQ